MKLNVGDVVKILDDSGRKGRVIASQADAIGNRYLVNIWDLAIITFEEDELEFIRGSWA